MTREREITMATVSVNATTEHRGTTARARLSAVPWLTVVPPAVVMAYADGFWMVALRGSVGSIERTRDPFAAWLLESTLSLPFFVLAVVAALMLAAHRFGPVLRTSKSVVATALLVVAAGTTVGIYEVATNSAYDYHLQTAELKMTGSMRSMGSTASTASTAEQEKASLGLQVRAVAYGSGLLLVTNLALVSWVVAMRGGQLKVSTTRP
jgi:hypothetical protein